MPKPSPGDERPPGPAGAEAAAGRPRDCGEERPRAPGTGQRGRARSRRHLSGELRDIAKTGGLGAEGSPCEGLRCRAVVSRGQPAIDQRAHSVLQQQSALAKPIPPLKHKLPLFFPHSPSVFKPSSRRRLLSRPPHGLYFLLLAYSQPPAGPIRERAAGNL